MNLTLHKRIQKRSTNAKLFLVVAVLLCLILLAQLQSTNNAVGEFSKPQVSRAGVDEGRSAPAPLAERVGHIAPRWCDALRRNPRPSGFNLGLCKERSRYESICGDGKARFFSQLHQDILLYEHHFKYLNRTGVYVDLAANEPVLMSNTYFFDTCLGWQGLCVEPNPKYQEPLRMLRTCEVETACLGDRPQNVSFVLADALSGVDATNKNKVAANRRISLSCKTTADALAEVGISHIDYLSLDVEGHEPQVLRGIDWNATTIDVMSIELEANVAEAVEILIRNGFRKLDTTHLAASVGGLWSNIDNIYIHRRVEWGKPV